MWYLLKSLVIETCGNNGAWLSLSFWIFSNSHFAKHANWLTFSPSKGEL